MKQPKLFNYLIGQYHPNGELELLDTGDVGDRTYFGSRKEANARLSEAQDMYPDSDWQIVRIATKRKIDH